MQSRPSIGSCLMADAPVAPVRYTPEAFNKCRALADKLLAACDGGADESDEIDALTQDEARMLDTMVLRCATCDHWFKTAEIIDDGNRYECKDCHTD